MRTFALLLVGGVALMARAAGAETEGTAFLKELVRIPSVSANVKEVNRAVGAMRSWLEKRGIPCAVETDADGRDALWASTVPGKEQDFVLVCHLDVVPAPEEMFQVVERDGKWFGRGVSDCKGNAVVCAETLVALAGKASVGCVFASDEELGGFTTAMMVKRGYRPRRMVIVTDLAEFGLRNSHKGHALLRLVAHGTTGHSSAPWASENALEKLIVGCANARREWDRAYPAATAEDVWHDTISITLASSSSKVANAIPARAEATASLRYVELDGCRKAVEFLRRVSGLEVEVIRDGGPVNADTTDPLMVRFADTMRRIWGVPSLQYGRENGATDARHFGALGLPILMVGSEAGDPHADGEWIDIRGLDRLRALLLEFLGEGK